MHFTHPLFSVAQIRAIEQDAAAPLPPGTLMRRAGAAAADAAAAILAQGGVRDGAQARVLLLVGPGNNGGDALEAAAHLARSGHRVVLWMAASAAGAPAGSPERQAALALATAGTASFSPSVAAIEAQSWDLVVDGLFGIGLSRPPAGDLRAAIMLVNRLDCPVLALDVPSGLDADSGAVVGPDGVAVRASHTITFIGDKTGLHTCDGQDHAGTVQVADLEIERRLFPPAQAGLNGTDLFGDRLRARRHNSNKGSYGSVAVVGGAHGMTGAPILAARSALYGGAGRVYIAFPDEAPAFDGGQPELMCRQAADVDFDSAVLVVGPGLGDSGHARALLLKAIDSDSALLLDADALNMVAADAPLRAALARRAGSCVLTPHPLEAARLLDIDVRAVQADRPGCARRLAAQLNAVVILKGSGTVIAGADGAIAINRTGNPALATAGTGDVLGGLCGALLAQGWPLREAALGAVWLHGRAADVLVSQGHGPIGLTAHELMPAIRAELNRLALRALS
ncbi:MAG: NAD(P)H-hydrate dehydratase [Pseudomonadota bacterium]